MKPFLLIQSRPEDNASDDEYASFINYMQINPDQLQRRRIESEPLGQVDLDSYAGVVVGGGPFNFTDTIKSPAQQRVESEMHSLLHEIVDRDYPFFGACYGIGLLVSFLGGTMSRKYGEAVSAPYIRISENDDPIFHGMPREFQAFVGHKEACEILPESATLLATSDSCPTQMLRVKTHIYATQFHPELRLDDILARVRIYKNHGYFPAEELEVLEHELAKHSVMAPQRLLTNFVEIAKRYSR